MDSPSVTLDDFLSLHTKLWHKDQLCGGSLLCQRFSQRGGSTLMASVGKRLGLTIDLSDLEDLGYYDWRKIPLEGDEVLLYNKLHIGFARDPAPLLTKLPSSAET